MKRTLLTIVLALMGISQLHAQDCANLFFSEYVEGSNNNKALAIYNPTKLLAYRAGHLRFSSFKRQSRCVC